MNEEASAFTQFLAERRSIRHFKTQPIPADILDQLLTSACQAPSAHNRQPWRFVVISSDGEKDKLARSMGERLRQQRLLDGHDPEDIDKDVQRSCARITGAPLLILLCLTMEQMDHYTDQPRVEAERKMGVQSVAMAGQNLLLAAHAFGLGACWLCAPLFAAQETQRALDFPETWEPQGLILLGYPADEVPRKARRAFEEVTLWR